MSENETPEPEVKVESVSTADTAGISEPEVQPITPAEVPTPAEPLPTPAPEPIQAIAPRVSFWKRLKPQHYALLIAAFVLGFYGASVQHIVKPAVVTPIPSITIAPTLIATPSATITPAKTLPFIAPKSTKGADALIPSKR